MIEELELNWKGTNRQRITELSEVESKRDREERFGEPRGDKKRGKKTQKSISSSRHFDFFTSSVSEVIVSLQRSSLMIIMS